MTTPAKDPTPDTFPTAELLGGAAELLRPDGPDHDVVVSSRVRLARNLAGFPFVAHASRTDRNQILDLCRHRLAAADGPGPFTWLRVHDLKAVDRSLLVERHLISKQHAKGAMAGGQGGPDEPRAAAISLPLERLSAMVNEEDHLRLQSLRAGLALADAYRDADALDDHIEAGLDFAFHPRLGYLTACPTNVGTGARFSVMLHLPGLRMTGDIEKVKRAADDMSLAIRGFYGEGSQNIGDFYQLSNQTTLGKSERVLLHDMESSIVPRVIEYERLGRRMLIERRRDILEDKVSRALGLLRSARLVASDEAMGLLSHVRLGIVLGLIPDVPLATVSGLMLLVQPAHLQRKIGREMPQAERRRARADLLRATLGREGLLRDDPAR
ncbi:MAG: protein arginine kinase [Phycisphaeraceae bacterium]|nr:protein arginine kinase [Phycisphaeraceae bacterium]